MSQVKHRPRMLEGMHGEGSRVTRGHTWVDVGGLLAFGRPFDALGGCPVMLGGPCGRCGLVTAGAIRAFFEGDLHAFNGPRRGYNKGWSLRRRRDLLLIITSDILAADTIDSSHRGHLITDVSTLL